MEIKNFEKGQILYLVAIALVALLGLTALAIDGTNVYKARRVDQSTADSAALAGAGAAANYLKTYPGFVCSGTAGTTDQIAEAKARVAAISTAASSTNSSGAPVVLLNNDLSTKNGVATDCKTSSSGAAYIEVHTMVSSSIKTYFLKLFSSTSPTTNVEALTKVTGSTLGSILNGTGLVSLSSSGCGLNFSSTALSVTGGGVFDNSNICSNWAPVISTTACINVYGTIDSNYTNGSQTITGPGFCNPKPAQLSSSAISTMFSVIPAPPNPPTCSTYKSYSFSDIIAGGAGVYCFPTNKSLSLSFADAGSGANKVVTIPGDVELVFSGTGGFNVNGGTYLTLNFGSLEMFVQNGSFYAGGGSFSVPNTFRYYQTGTSTSSSVGFDGGSNDTFGDAFFYLASGKFGLDGSINLIATAPASGPYKGILIYQPINNTNTLYVSGGGLFKTVGSILVPGATIYFEGSTTTAVIDSQMVGNTIQVNGGSKINIQYDSSVNYAGSGQPLTIDILH